MFLSFLVRLPPSSFRATAYSSPLVPSADNREALNSRKSVFFVVSAGVPRRAPRTAFARNLLSRLNDSWATKPDAVEIQVGTIHGFQGDECDIIIAVLNPPPAISRSPQMFFNKQNILNVAISRARDYLFIIMPDDETEGVENLHKLAKIQRLVKSGGAFTEYASRTVEEMIWGSKNYLEENTFSTGHQMVNVYRKPERYYEVSRLVSRLIGHHRLEAYATCGEDSGVNLDAGFIAAQRACVVCGARARGPFTGLIRCAAKDRKRPSRKIAVAPDQPEGHQPGHPPFAKLGRTTGGQPSDR